MKVIYTQDNCPECIRLKLIYDSQGIEYLELDAREYMDYLVNDCGVKSLPYEEETVFDEDL